MNQIRNRKAISPAVATIILVAIAVAIAIAVGFYWSGLIESQTGIESIDLLVATDFGDFDIYTSVYKVTIYMKNIGSLDTTIDGIFINNVRWYDTDVLKVTFNIEDVPQETPMKFTLPIGKQATMELLLGSTFKHGTTIEVKIHTAAGSSMVQTQRLP